MAAAVRQAFVGVGANLGDRWATMAAALADLASEPGIEFLERSPVYETAPVGVLDQPLFLNLAAGVETTLSPEALIAVLHRLEAGAGRRREVRWGPRTLDLDLLLFEGETRADPGLTLPHPRLWERAFVTVPLRDLLDRDRWRTRPAWAAARTRLAALPAGVGVTPWEPPG